MSTRGQSKTEETEKERVDRELMELLNELRVTLPGVQMLFAFLLILPFSQGFPKIAAPERAAFIVALLSAAGSAALLVAPAAFHRLNFRTGTKVKEQILFTSNRVTILGQALLALAMSLVVYVVTSPIVPTWAAVAMGLGTGIFFAWMWYGLGILVVRRNHGKPEGSAG